MEFVEGARPAFIPSLHEVAILHHHAQPSHRRCLGDQVGVELVQLLQVDGGYVAAAAQVELLQLRGLGEQIRHAPHGDARPLQRGALEARHRIDAREELVLEEGIVAAEVA